MTIRMGYWDCPACGRERIEGPQEACTGCGRPRDADVKFYTDGQAPAVTDPALVARARAGADWHCRFCGADNRAGMIECHACGAGPDGTKQRQQQFAPAMPMAQAQPKKSGMGILVAILGVLALVVGGIWFFFIRTTEATMTVTSVSWVKTAQIETLEVEKKSAWKDEVPKGAKEIKRTTKSRTKEVQDGTKKVKVGQKDLGNGMFEDVYEERPNMVKKKVDDTWVTYEIKRWVEGKKLTESSDDGDEPDDPKFKGDDDDTRIKERTSAIHVELKAEDGEKHTYVEEVDGASEGKKVFKRYASGDRVIAEITTAGAVVKLRSP